MQQIGPSTNFGGGISFCQEPQVKPYDGLDLMLLMGWVSKRFSGLNDLPFVLRYWDLQMPNIVVDEEENLVAYN